MPQQKISLPIPSKTTRDERVAIADDVIEFIRSRTEDGLDKRGKKFKKYSKEYIKSLDFNIAGKSPGEVNLKLSGDMLAALKLLRQTENKIVIGYEQDSEENDRAEGNILGSYGGDPDPKKARDFLGIDKEVFAEIVAKNIGKKKDQKLMRFIERHISEGQ